MGMCDNNEVMMNYDEKFSSTITNILMKKTEKSIVFSEDYSPILSSNLGND